MTYRAINTTTNSLVEHALSLAWGRSAAKTARDHTGLNCPASRRIQSHLNKCGGKMDNSLVLWGHSSQCRHDRVRSALPLQAESCSGHDETGTRCVGARTQWLESVKGDTVCASQSPCVASTWPHSTTLVKPRQQRPARHAKPGRVSRPSSHHSDGAKLSSAVPS